MHNISVLSLSFSAQADGLGLTEADVLDLISQNMTGTEDLILLPETCLGERINESEDQFLSALAQLARKGKTYILIGLYRAETKTTHANSAFLFNREGELAFCYDKIYPYLAEFDRTDSVIKPGSRIVFADTDFGRVSTAICFDANFSDLWQDIADADVDIVLFCSAYSAGSQLSAHALNHHYTIVTATQKPDFAIYDIDGRETTYTRKKHNQVLISRAMIDMDKVICHHNFNLDKIAALIQDQPEKIEIQHNYEREEWCVIRSTSSKISARKLCREYGIETLRDYKRRSKRQIDSLRII